MRFQVLSILKLFALRIEEYANAAPLCKIFTKREKSLFIHTTTTALPTFFFLQEYVVKRRIGWLWDFSCKKIATSSIFEKGFGLPFLYKGAR